MPMQPKRDALEFQHSTMSEQVTVGLPLPFYRVYLTTNNGPYEHTKLARVPDYCGPFDGQAKNPGVAVRMLHNL